MGRKYFMSECYDSGELKFMEEDAKRFREEFKKLCGKSSKAWLEIRLYYHDEVETPSKKKKKKESKIEVIEKDEKLAPVKKSRVGSTPVSIDASDVDAEPLSSRRIKNHVKHNGG
jgi:hypothetical protein